MLAAFITIDEEYANYYANTESDGDAADLDEDYEPEIDEDLHQPIICCNKYSKQLSGTKFKY